MSHNRFLFTKAGQFTGDFEAMHKAEDGAAVDSCKVFAWGNGEYYKKYKNSLPFKISNVITHDNKSNFKVSSNDIVIVMSISSYGAIYNDALALGFSAENIYSVSEYIKDLTSVEYFSTVNTLKNSKLLINRIGGKVTINNGLTLISEQHKSLIESFKNSSIEFNNNTLYENIEISVRKNAKLHIGNKTYINKNCTIRCYENILIGSSCAFSYNVNIADWGGYNVYPLTNKSRSIKIGDNCWIANSVNILGGVTIGNNVVIGANSVVTKDIPDNSLVVGNPARVVKEIDGWG